MYENKMIWSSFHMIYFNYLIDLGWCLIAKSLWKLFWYQTYFCKEYFSKIYRFRNENYNKFEHIKRNFPVSLNSKKIFNIWYTISCHYLETLCERSSSFSKALKKDKTCKTYCSLSFTYMSLKQTDFRDIFSFIL